SDTTCALAGAAAAHENKPSASAPPMNICIIPLRPVPDRPSGCSFGNNAVPSGGPISLVLDRNHRACNSSGGRRGGCSRFRQREQKAVQHLPGGVYEKATHFRCADR